MCRVLSRLDTGSRGSNVNTDVSSLQARDNIWWKLCVNLNEFWFKICRNFLVRKSIVDGADDVLRERRSAVDEQLQTQNADQDLSTLVKFD